jgi:hypothetical protein
MLAACVAILAFAMTGNSAANRDFICYWAAGHQLANHANPYDGQEILALERSAGYVGVRPFYMRNPPYAFFLALPLGFVGAKTGAVLWMLGLLGSLVFSARMIWEMNGKPPDRLHMVGYAFAPAMACLFAGQIGLFILLGVVLFLRYHSERPGLAGYALLLCALKPHLFLPWGVVLIAWALWGRRWSILFASAIALTSALLFAFALDPAGWSHYARMAAGERLDGEWIPTLSLMFRLALYRSWLWLQFVPALSGCIWAAWYFWSRREHWSWAVNGSILLIVSVMVAPYAWFTDEAILLPAIIGALYATSDRGRLLFGLFATAALIEVLIGTSLTSGLYLWTAPVWLLWYLSCAWRSSELPILRRVNRQCRKLGSVLPPVAVKSGG